MASKRNHDYAFNIVNNELIISERTGREIAMPNHRVSPCWSPGPLVPGAWPSTPCDNAQAFTETTSELEETRRSYCYTVGKYALVPLACFLLALPFRLLGLYFRPQQVVVQNTQENGARKRRIIDAGAADKPYTPTPRFRTRTDEHPSRHNRHRAGGLADRLRRVEQTPTSPPAPMQYLIESPQSVADKSKDDSSLFEISFNPEHCLTSTPPPPCIPAGPYDSPDGPDGCSDVSPYAPGNVADQAGGANAADIAAKEIVGTPPVVAAAVKSTFSKSNIPLAQQYSRPFKAVWPNEKSFHKSSAVKNIQRPAHLFPFKPSVPQFAPFAKNPMKCAQAKTGPKAARVGPRVLDAGKTPKIHHAPLRMQDRRVLHTSLSDPIHLPIVPEGISLAHFRPSVLQQQNALQCQHAQDQQYIPHQHHVSEQQYVHQQQHAYQQYMPASLHITETVDQELSHLDDAPDADYGGEFAIADPIQTPTIKPQALLTKVTTSPFKRSIQFASHAERNTYFNDTKINSKMDAKVEETSAISMRRSASGHHPTSSPHIQKAPTRCVANNPRSAGNYATHNEDPAHGAANKKPSIDNQTTNNEAPTSCASTSSCSARTPPSYVDTPNKLSLTTDVSAPAITVAHDKEQLTTEDAAVEESEFSVHFTTELCEALPVLPTISDELGSGDFDSLFDDPSLPPVRAFVTPLSEEEQDTLDTAAAATDHGKIKDAFVVDPKLRAKDFGTLLPKEFKGDPSAWLNDEIVNEYLQILTKAIKARDGFPAKQKAGTGVVPRVHAVTSFWYTTVAGKDGIDKTKNWAHRAHIGGRRYLDCELVLYPICATGHWRLLAVKPKERSIEYLDSMSMTSSMYIKHIKAYLKNELGDDWNEDEWTVVRHQRSTQQLNSSDCGVFVLLNALALLRGVEITEVLACDGMLDARKRIAVTIMKQAPTTEFD